MSGDTHDWTRGPAKWFGAGLLGGAAIIGLIWSTVARTSAREPASSGAFNSTLAGQPGGVRGAPEAPAGLSAQPSRDAGEVQDSDRVQRRELGPKPSGSLAATPGAADEEQAAALGTSEPAAPTHALPPDVPAPGAVSATGVTPAGVPASVPGAGSEPVAPASIIRRVNLNRASQAELESLPGIGPALAKRIIDFRSSKGAFRRVDELDQVSGIGPRTLEKLRPLVSVD